MAIDPWIARGSPGVDVSNTLAEIAALRQRDRTLDIAEQRNSLYGQEDQRKQITEQQKQQLVARRAEVESIAKAPPALQARWLQVQASKPGWDKTPVAGLPPEQAIPMMQAELAALLGESPEQPKQLGALYKVDQGGRPVYMPADQAVGASPWQEPDKPPAPKEPRQPSEWELYQSMTDEQRALFDKMKGRGGAGGAGVTVGADGQLTVDPASIKASEGERKVAALGVRLEAALRNLEIIRQRNPKSDRPTFGEVARSGVPLVGEMWANSSRSPDRQQADAAQGDALDAALTLATGAAYTKEQLAGLRKAYFPQVGDSEETVKFKEQQFNNIVQAARVNAGRAEPTINAALDASGQSKKPTGKNPEVEAALNPEEGQRGKSRSGKPIIYRGGRWEYE